jgi:hypothetical protein
MIIMIKLKNGFLVLLMAAVLALLFAGMAQAVLFTYYGGGINSTSNAYAHGVSGEQGPIVDAHSSSQNADSSAIAQAFYASAQGVGSGEWNSSANYLDISLSGRANGGAAYASESYWAFGNANTDSLLFRLDPSPGERPGGLVKVSFGWSASSYPYYVNGKYYAGGSSSISGGSTDTMSITLNSDTKWSHEKVSVEGVALISEEEQGRFYAHVGDIIGINLGAEARMDSSMISFREQHVNNSMTLTSEYVVPLPWLGLLLLAD